MFFGYITGLLIFLGFMYLAWRWIAKPILESHGIECDEPKVEPEPEPTGYETRRGEVEKDLNTSRRNADAADDILAMSDEKAEYEATIKAVEKELEK